MRHVGRLLLVTLVQGILFLVALVLVAVLAREGYQMLRRLSQPVARLLPEDRFFGILAEDLVSIMAIIVLFLIAGLFVGTMVLISPVDESNRASPSLPPRAPQQRVSISWARFVREVLLSRQAICVHRGPKSAA